MRHRSRSVSMSTLFVMLATSLLTIASAAAFEELSRSCGKLQSRFSA